MGCVFIYNPTVRCGAFFVFLRCGAVRIFFFRILRCGAVRFVKRQNRTVPCGAVRCGYTENRTAPQEKNAAFNPCTVRVYITDLVLCTSNIEVRARTAKKTPALTWSCLHPKRGRAQLSSNTRRTYKLFIRLKKKKEYSYDPERNGTYRVTVFILWKTFETTWW